MTHLSSETYFIPSSMERIHAYVSKPSNLEALLPADKFRDFVASKDHCEFTISGGIVVSLHLLSSEQKEIVSYRNGEQSSFTYCLHINLSPGTGGLYATFCFDYDAPPFVSMMVKNPLTALMKDMAERLVTTLSNEA